MKIDSIKTQVILFLPAFAVFLSVKDRDAAFLFTTCIAVVFAALCESVFIFLKEKKLVLTESSIISGLIIGFVIFRSQPWWVFALAAIFAITSKHVIRFNNKHIFNPAAFGIFAAIILLRAQTQWQGTYDWYILAPAGLYAITKIRKLELFFGYAVVTLVLFGAQAVMQKVPVLNIFGYLSYFYIFVMIIEPRTTPVKPRAKWLFGALLAALIFVLTALGVKFDVELASLLIMNMFVALLNKLG
ncbi:MAG: RnfABCDGE type electron transport complex subunit D [Candidatus Omnitrophota bacterium]